MAIEINIPKPTAEWGEIDGNLSDQTDLQTALNLKANSAAISAVGFSNQYNDLDGKPTIPSVAGATGEIQFNNGGVFGASANLKFEDNTLKIIGLVSSQGAAKTQDSTDQAIVDINNFVLTPRGTASDRSYGLRIKGTMNFDAVNQIGRGLFIDIASNATTSQSVRPIEVNWAANMLTSSRISNSSMGASAGNRLEIARGNGLSTGQRLILSSRSTAGSTSKGIIFQDFEVPNYWAVGTADSDYLRFFHNSGSPNVGLVHPTMWLKNKRVGIGQYSAFNPLATLHVKGEGSTNATATQIWQNANGVQLMRVSDGGNVWAHGSGFIPSNTAFGLSALINNTTGNQNSAYGVHALENNTTGANNSVIGVHALRTNTTGGWNSAIGVSALRFNTSGTNNSAIGFDALRNNTTGANNSAIGVRSLYANTTGVNNSAIGVEALYAKVIGSNNVGIGHDAGRYHTALTAMDTVNNSIFIGYRTKALANGQTNQIVIGHDAIGAGSNTATIGNASIIKTILRGILNAAGLPTSSVGLASGDVWNDGGTLKIV